MYAIERCLADEPGSVTLARDITRHALSEYHYRGPQDDVLLVVSELVTNALVHGRGTPVLRLVGDAVRIRVEVSDGDPGLPQCKEPGPSGGWGLNLVEQLAVGWGASPRDGGKVVWCELEATAEPTMATPHGGASENAAA